MRGISGQTYDTGFSGPADNTNMDLSNQETTTMRQWDANFLNDYLLDQNETFLQLPITKQDTAGTTHAQAAADFQFARHDSKRSQTNTSGTGSGPASSGPQQLFKYKTKVI